jgi:hypothetical protein
LSKRKQEEARGIAATCAEKEAKSAKVTISGSKEKPDGWTFEGSWAIDSGIQFAKITVPDSSNPTLEKTNFMGVATR